MRDCLLELIVGIVGGLLPQLGVNSEVEDEIIGVGNGRIKDRFGVSCLLMMFVELPVFSVAGVTPHVTCEH